MMTGIIDAARPAADCKTRTTENSRAATKPGSARAPAGECRQAMAEAAAESRTIVPWPGWLSTDIVPR